MCVCVCLSVSTSSRICAYVCASVCACGLYAALEKGWRVLAYMCFSACFCVCLWLVCGSWGGGRGQGRVCPLSSCMRARTRLTFGRPCSWCSLPFSCNHVPPSRSRMACFVRPSSGPVALRRCVPMDLPATRVHGHPYGVCPSGFPREQHEARACSAAEYNAPPAPLCVHPPGHGRWFSATATASLRVACGTAPLCFPS